MSKVLTTLVVTLSLALCACAFGVTADISGRQYKGAHPPIEPTGAIVDINLIELDCLE